MSKAKLTDMAKTWISEGQDNNKQENTSAINKSDQKNDKNTEKQTKRKQTFNLQTETIKRLWNERIKTGKSISQIIDELVNKNLAKTKIE